MDFVTTAIQDVIWVAANPADRLSRFLAGFRAHWRLAAAIMAVSIALSLALGFLLPSYWRVEVTLMPASKNSGGLDLGGAANLVGGLSGLGSLLGRGGTNEDEAIAILKSRQLFDIYATRENILPVLFADKWNASAKRWSVSPANVPTLRQGFKLFDHSIRDVELDRRSGIVTLAITWRDRALAVIWARDLVALANEQLRRQAMDEAAANLRYLTDAMRSGGSETDSNALSAALANAYERALQDYMSAKGRQDFAFRVIDPPTLPDARERVSPQRSVLLLLGIVLGAALAVTVVHGWSLWEKRRSAQPS